MPFQCEHINLRGMPAPQHPPQRQARAGAPPCAHDEGGAGDARARASAAGTAGPGRAEGPAPAPEPAPYSPWQADLPPELIVHIVTLSGRAEEGGGPRAAQRAVGATAFSCSRVCRSWRHALCRYHAGFLNSIELRGLGERGSPSPGGRMPMPKVRSAPALGAAPAEGARADAGAGLSRVPRFVLAAARNNNPSALALAADWLQRMGDVHLAVRTWRKAARLGSVVAQVQLGKIIMDGDLDYLGVYESVLQRRHRLLLDGGAGDGDGAAADRAAANADAIHRCARGIYGAGGADAGVAAGADGPEDRGGDGGERKSALDVQCLEELQDKSQAALYLSKAVQNSDAERSDIAVAATLLGFIILDGVAESKSDAVEWFKLAAANGSESAEETLGWMFNTGQF